MLRRVKAHAVGPSQWIIDRARNSLLAESDVEFHVIPNGVDTNVFAPGDRRRARTLLGLPDDAQVAVFVASGGRKNEYKDFPTLLNAFRLAARRVVGPLILLCIGDVEARTLVLETAAVRFVPYEVDPHVIAAYYQAADLYVHAAKAETFPTVVLEALACGLPVVATAVGGISEQIKHLKREPDEKTGLALEEATGILTRPGDAEDMADAIIRLLKDAAVRLRLGSNAARDARHRFSLERMVDNYLWLYNEVLTATPQGSLR